MNEQIIEELRKDSFNHYRLRVEKFIESANSTESNFRNLLFTLSTFLFTFSTLIFTKPNFITIDIKILLFISWIFIILSMLFGGIHQILDLKFFIESANISSQQSSFFRYTPMSFPDFEKSTKDSELLEMNHPKQTNQIPLILQSTFISISFLMILTVTSLILFRIK